MMDANHYYKYRKQPRWLVEILFVIFVLMLFAIPISFLAAIITGYWQLLLITVFCVWMTLS
jgi:hypothetical protein